MRARAPLTRPPARRLPPAQRMLIYEPHGRITAKDALLHPYFDELDKSAVAMGLRGFKK